VVFHLKTKQDKLVNHERKIADQRRNYESLMIVANAQSVDIQRERFLRLADQSLKRWQWLVENPPRAGERTPR